MTLLASLFTAVAVYCAVGLLTGWTPQYGRRRAPKPEAFRLHLWLIQAGTGLTARQFVLGSAALGLLTFVLATLATGTWWLGIVPGVAGAALPRVFYGKRRADRLRRIRQAWPDALRDALASIGAGSTLFVALCELADRGPVPLRPAFGRFRLLSRMMGALPALEMVKEELADATSDRVIEVLSLAYEHGGGLVQEVLRDLVAEITQDLRLEAEIHSDGTEQRIESRVVLVIPWLLLLILTFTSEEYRSFYRSSSGLFVVMVALAWSLVGIGLMKYIGRSPSERRVLVRPIRDDGAAG